MFQRLGLRVLDKKETPAVSVEINQNNQQKEGTGASVGNAIEDFNTVCCLSGYSCRKEEIENATLFLERAKTWTIENPTCWQYIFSIIEKDVKAKRRASMKKAIELARAKSFVNVYGEDTKINNILTPAFSRIIIEQFPEWKQFLEIRKSRLDALEGVSHWKQ